MVGNSASEYGHDSVVKLLLADRRVNPSVYNNYAIRRASENGHYSEIYILHPSLMVGVFWCVLGLKSDYVLHEFLSCEIKAFLFEITTDRQLPPAPPSLSLPSQQPSTHSP